MNMDRIDQELQEIANHIDAEKHLLHVMKNYRDCDLKTMVIHQCQGAIRGLEIGREKLLFVRETITAAGSLNQTTIDDFGIDYRGGMIGHG